MKKQGFTLIELIVVLAIIVVLAALIIPVFMPTKYKQGQTFQGQVTDKWTDIDQDQYHKIYRIRTVTPDGSVDTWDSQYCHDKFQVGYTYQFKSYYPGVIIYDVQQVFVPVPQEQK